MPDTTTTAPELTKQDDALYSLPDLVLDNKVGDDTIATEIAAAIPTASHIKETFNVDPLSTDDEIDMDAVDALLSLSSVWDDSKDPTLENEQIMPIGGLNLPVDVAPVPIELGQIQIDRAIAELTEQEQMDIQDTSKNTDAADADVEVKDTENQNIEINETNKVTNSSASKGVFKTTIHGLKKKKDSRRIYKCSVCGVRKGSMQLLNDHHKWRHGPQMCGICGRVFELATSLNRHMYTHEETRYKCENCEFKCYFESELLTHNIVHRKTPTYKCMVAKCDRWFKRKWELTNHVHTHDDDMLKCDSCNFMTKLKKQLKEHVKTKHDEDLPYKCKLCHKKFQYRSGRKRHMDRDHKWKSMNIVTT